MHDLGVFERFTPDPADGSSIDGPLCENQAGNGQASEQFFHGNKHTSHPATGDNRTYCADFHQVSCETCNR
jgi:hypothetical protein